MSKYSRQTYEEIAQVLFKNSGYLAAQQYMRFVSAFADVFEQDNPRFQRQTFIKACMGTDRLTVDT